LAPAGFDQWNQRGNTKPGGCQRACYREADRDVGLQHFFGEELASLAESRGVVGEKSFVNYICNKRILFDWARIDSFAPQVFAFLFTHLFIRDSLPKRSLREPSLPAVDLYAVRRLQELQLPNLGS
jgi:hypothetical protein